MEYVIACMLFVIAGVAGAVAIEFIRAAVSTAQAEDMPLGRDH